MDAQPFTFTLIDRSAGHEATPDRVPLGELASFVADVETFLRGENRDTDTAALDVAVKAGSLAIQTVPMLPAAALLRDLLALLKGELLDMLDVRRRDVIAKWQKSARGSPLVAYRISAPFLPRPVVVDVDTDYRVDDADQWVAVERYIRGEILDLGGATRANAHVRLPDGSTLKVNTERSVLRDETVNRLYKCAVLRIRARYNVMTRQLRDARLLEFVEYAPTFDEAELETLTRRGAKAWEAVDDATAWVDELRGGVGN